ncbi:ubiquinone anaerobic biosynthesis accessory factor UbiT [Thioalkalivibrio paradoxus]|uniref:Ubiquinone biosynthesis accessory factor UbiT n=1 Tax=Thioalkalivibrio paradoxus ARh 1 TaxID=713585 RepID=W0DMM5_9GAMM|nr:SCP2 sterol-binding domain-containing protein [Thioalkalivibrio paradoxus]AHE98233.1 hypothetical protein THITH_08100 [Thioalkalivibrio paradoxus ARh 1]
MTLTLPRTLLDRIPAPSSAALISPLGALPPPLMEALVARATQHLLAEALEDGSLELLEGRVLAVTVTDPTLRMRFTLDRGHLRSAHAGRADVTVTASADDFLLLVAQRTDPDTLFFHRRLRLSGNTELGLAVKNVLDTIDLSWMPAPLKALLDRAADGVEQRRAQSGPASATPR